MTARPKTTRPARPIEPGGLDFFGWAWKLLTNVKFALLLVGLALVAGLIGVVLPQVPGPMRGNPAARSAWLELRRDTYGPFTGSFDALGLFDVFHSAWFNGLWVLIILAVTVCTVSRFRPTWRAVQRPQRAVPDSYFEHAHHRADFAYADGAEPVEALLRRKRYRVEHVTREHGATYLFADRFAWSHYGTFVSHLALLMLLIGALLTVFAGFDRTLVVAETTPAAPVFDTPGPNQVFVRMVEANRGLDDDGNIIDYHSIIEVRRGEETVTCKTTVNDPCSAFGYRVHQAAWFNDIARLRVEAPNGQPLYDDIVDFENQTALVPFLRVSSVKGDVLFNQQLPQMATDTGVSPERDDDSALSLLVFPDSLGSSTTATYAVGWQFRDGTMHVSMSGAGLTPISLEPGGTVFAEGYRFDFIEVQAIPVLSVADMPGAFGDEVTIQMPTGRDGVPYLLLTGVSIDPLVLAPDTSVENEEGYTYTFRGQVEASGLSIRRDPGDTFIWIAVAMAMVGLASTFYLPRRRLWVKVTPTRVYMAGMAERTARFSRELRLLGHELGSRDAAHPEDLLRGED
ncbi:MAG TPA: cytochrome c biogenesis protein ResB [Tepidiformaceae bacterium]|nr:cytochrome c biogenesis protein ResB [Tepidiformaceae bacterium]